MMIEFLNELLNDVSPFYFYISMFWTTVGAIRLIHMNAPLMFKHRLHIKYTLSLKHKNGMIEAPFTENMAIQTRLVHIFKRIDAPDDDADDHAPSDNFSIINIRGGRQWRDHLYSHSLKNMA